MHISRFNTYELNINYSGFINCVWKISQIFFQQDEWLGLGGAVYRQETFGAWGSIIQVFNFQNRNMSLLVFTNNFNSKLPALQ